MTTATPDGRRLRLHVADGIDDFLVDPVSAKRGLALSEAFVNASLSRFQNDIGLKPLSVQEMERIFVEALGVDNYERMAGVLVDPATFDRIPELDPEDPDYRPEPEGEPMRHEEQQEICLAAFYWQSVVGMDAVQILLSGEDLAGPKALARLVEGLGLSLSLISPSSESATQTQSPGASPATSTPNGGKTSVRLPPARPSRSPRKKQGAPNRG
jgi:hypothetical protein